MNTTTNTTHTADTTHAARKAPPANATFYEIPPGTKPSACRGPNCEQSIYFVTNPRTGSSVPVSVDFDGCELPSEASDPTQVDLLSGSASVHPGRGVSHFFDCVDADLFSRRGREPMTALELPVRERPILFATPLVRAILEGRKSQTRRVMKLAPWMERAGMSLDDVLFVDPGLGGGAYPKIRKRDDETVHRLHCRYAVGDRLWVREAFRERSSTGYSALHGEQDAEWIEYRADVSEAEPGNRWRPSIHMPREHSRITLEVTSVRAERLQAITENDARAEGLEPDTSDLRGYGPYVSAFAYVWQTLNAKRGYPWTANPWVWVVGFRRREE